MDRRNTLSIVIITKDTRELLRSLLVSIEKDSSLKPLVREIVVVDNGSGDGTDGMVREEFHRVSLIRSETNLGFAAAANLGFRASTGELVFFLNSDTLLVEGEARKMVSYMEGNHGVGICGPQLIYPDLKPQRSSAAIPSLLSEIVPRPLLELVSPRKHSGRPEAPSKKPVAAKGGHATERTDPDVDSLIGAAVMVRRSAMERVSGFDERFFFFLEETDLCMRMKTEGFRVVLLKEARVVHLQGKTVRKNWVRGRMEYNISMYKFIRKHHSPFYCKCFQSVRFTKAAAFLTAVTVLPFLLIGARTRRTYAYYAGLVRWHLGGFPDDAGLKASPRK